MNEQSTDEPIEGNDGQRKCKNCNGYGNFFDGIGSSPCYDCKGTGKAPERTRSDESGQDERRHVYTGPEQGTGGSYASRWVSGDQPPTEEKERQASKICDTCDGFGEFPWDESCPDCDGWGEFFEGQDGFDD